MTVYGTLPAAACIQPLSYLAFNRPVDFSPVIFLLQTPTDTWHGQFSLCPTWSSDRFLMHSQQRLGQRWYFWEGRETNQSAPVSHSSAGWFWALKRQMGLAKPPSMCKWARKDILDTTSISFVQKLKASFKFQDDLRLDKKDQVHEWTSRGTERSSELPLCMTQRQSWARKPLYPNYSMHARGEDKAWLEKQRDLPLTSECQ